MKLSEKLRAFANFYEEQLTDQEADMFYAAAKKLAVAEEITSGLSDEMSRIVEAEAEGKDISCEILTPVNDKNITVLVFRIKN